MEKNKPIKFDHNYKMLHNQKSAILLRVDSLNSDMVTIESRDFATEYGLNSTDYGNMHSGSVLRLTFLGCKGVPFLKFLRSNDKTWKRYLSHLQEEFPIVIEKGLEVVEGD